MYCARVSLQEVDLVDRVAIDSPGEEDEEDEDDGSSNEDKGGEGKDRSC